MPEPEEQRTAFISYCHVDKEIAVAVQAAVETHTGWVAFRDETDVEPGDPLPRKLAEAIDRSDLFIAIVSDAYKASEACMWELDRAVARKFGDDPLRVVPLQVGDVAMPPTVSAELYVPVERGTEASAVEQVLRSRRATEQLQDAARPSGTRDGATTPTGTAAPRDLVREAVRYARELEALSQIDEALVEVQRSIESAARSYDESAYIRAYDLWQEVWVRRTSPIADPELLDRIQVVGSLLSEVVLSDRTPRQIRPWVVQRAVTSARASLGYAMRGEALPVAAFPGMAELRDLLGKGDGTEDPSEPLRARLAELGTPSFHPEP